MPAPNLPLARNLRNALENTVKAAREVAETAARAALGHLGVGNREAPSHLSDEQKALRRRLRTHGRQLEDGWLASPSGRGAGGEGREQSLQRLVWEVAYEHWHRMLFARFLAENHLLMWEPGAPVTLAECAELATDPATALGAKSGWELAGILAARMLPHIFKPLSPTLAVAFAPEHQRALEKLLAGLPAEVFTASDSLGWVYQFWQAQRKDEVNASEVKIGADELPAVTQLFTEPYMVEFLLHNSLGAWWATRNPDQPCPVPLPYLRATSSSPLPVGEGLGARACKPPLPDSIRSFARELRCQQTTAESLLWNLLRDRRLAGRKFRRQHPVPPYILDFYCHEEKLAIELDGSQHNEAAGKARDDQRTAFLADQGIRVLRFWNNEVLEQTEGVLEAMYEALTPNPSPSEWGESSTLTPNPSPGGRGEPAAGSFAGWPDSLRSFKLLDPCCGSGHFLVAAFLMLMPMRMATEGLSAREAVDAVLRDNLHGLELDHRCVEIAAFALALAAWTYPDAGGYRPLPPLHVACCGLKVSAKVEDWAALVPNDAPHAALLRQEFKLLHTAMQDAPLLGSLLDPWRHLKNDLAMSDFGGLQKLLTEALTTERPQLWNEAEEQWDAAVSAQGLLAAARLLAQRYHLVITNVPYLARGKQSDQLKAFCETHYGRAKNDLANVFLERCLELALPPSPNLNPPLPLGEGLGVRAEVGIVQIVMPQNWLFLGSYKKQREHLLKTETWNLLVRLGPGAFDTISGEVVNAILLTLTHTKPTIGQILRGLDASAPRTVEEKATLLREAEVVAVEQAGQLGNPDARVALESNVSGDLLEKYAYSHEGLTTGDLDRFVRNYWEITSNKNWRFYIQNTIETTYYSGRTDIIHWGNNGEIVASFSGSFVKGKNAWGQNGLRVTQMRDLPVTLYTGEIFGKNAATVVPHNPTHLPAIWCFCSSPEYNEAVRRIDQKLNVTNATLVKVPFDLAYWQQIAAERYPNGLPQPYSDDPTQWIFHGHPLPCALTPNPSPDGRGGSDCLQVAVARLLGYRWPAESALTPDPSPTGRGEQEMELSDEAHAWIARCEALAHHADDDGIVCLPPVRGEKPTHERLLALLIDAWETVQPGSWKPSILDKLLADADCAGKSLETWLRDKFFEQHCKRFHHRPFIWHVWDGLKDGFAALVNYHLLDAKNLERLIHTYLGDWIRTQEAGVANGMDGAQTRLAAARALKSRLELIYEGEKPYDLFVRWKPLDQQPIGWNPDLNDGVRLNIRPFMTAEVLRHNKPPKLNVKWDKDRGKDVESAPWFPLFKGERINDHHLTLAEKSAARQAKI